MFKKPQSFPKSKTRSSRKGFSLLEVMVGTAVMGIIMLSVPAAYVGLRKLNFETDTMIRSGRIVSAELETLRTLPYSDLEDMVGNPTHSAIPHSSRDNIIFAVKTEVKEGSDELDGMLEAVVLVTWIENSRKRDIIGRAFFAENGLSDKKFDDAN